MSVNLSTTAPVTPHSEADIEMTTACIRRYVAQRPEVGRDRATGGVCDRDAPVPWGVVVLFAVGPSCACSPAPVVERDSNATYDPATDTLVIEHRGDTTFTDHNTSELAVYVSTPVPNSSAATATRPIALPFVPGDRVVVRDVGPASDVRVHWTSADGDSSATLAYHEIPAPGPASPTDGRTAGAALGRVRPI